MSLSVDRAREEKRGSPRIERMTEHDLLEVVEIEEASGLSCWGWDAYNTELRDGRSGLMLVVHCEPTDGRRLAAFLASRLVADQLHINNIAVRVEFRQQGIGSALLGRVIEVGARAGARTATLEVRDSNKIAQALYSLHGFEIVGRRKAYYAAPVEDALIMNAQLGTEG